MIDSTNRPTLATETLSNIPSSPGKGRDIDAILKRRQDRLQQRREVFPPDFIHGEARLGEVYDVLGATWAEQALFIEPIVDTDGQVLAITVAYFDDYFMTVEQAVRGEVEDLEAWLEERAAERGRSVWLFVDGLRALSPSRSRRHSAVVIECSLERLLDMERSLLSLTRDIDPGDRNRFEETREAVLSDSRTNILSLIALSARLIP
ncbi:MAG: hypothetical protein ACNA8W_13105 [Bradymonadaceae bacterium]